MVSLMAYVVIAGGGALAFIMVRARRV
jgi:ABC-2 type transport system permease protein